jgi:hypothetical protein
VIGDMADIGDYEADFMDSEAENTNNNIEVNNDEHQSVYGDFTDSGDE